MSDEYKVTTEPVDARLSFLDGHWEEVVIFVPEAAGSEASLATRLLDYFNNSRGAFLAVKRQKKGENILLIRESLIRWVEIAKTDWLEDADRAGKACPVGISFFSGDKLRGTIYNNLPSGKQRVLDFMNQAELCYLMEGKDRVYIVSREATARVDDPPLL